MEPLLPLIPLFFLTALVYSMAGFAGGSTYLALLVLFGFPHAVIPRLGLICNIIVAMGGVYHFSRFGALNRRMLLPLLLGSIPAAYLGGRMPVREDLFLLLLGISLLCASLRLMFGPAMSETVREQSWSRTVLLGLPIGAGLGLLSGLTGIGGGIFLSPVLLLLHWMNAKEAAASSSLFILANSVAGLAGQFAKGGMMPETPIVLWLAAAVLVGGQIGSRLGANRIPLLALQRVTALFILGAAGRLLISSF